MRAQAPVEVARSAHAARARFTTSAVSARVIPSLHAPSTDFASDLARENASRDVLGLPLTVLREAYYAPRVSEHVQPVWGRRRDAEYERASQHASEGAAHQPEPGEVRCDRGDRCRAGGGALVLSRRRRVGDGRQD